MLALPALGAPPLRATLELRSTDPIIVTGRGFVAREPVLLTARAGNLRRVVPLVARRDGSFTARFKVRLRPCDALAIRAVGTRGSRAILQVEPACESTREARQAGWLPRRKR